MACSSPSIGHPIQFSCQCIACSSFPRNLQLSEWSHEPESRFGESPSTRLLCVNEDPGGSERLRSGHIRLGNGSLALRYRCSENHESNYMKASYLGDIPSHNLEIFC